MALKRPSKGYLSHTHTHTLFRAELAKQRLRFGRTLLELAEISSRPEKKPLTPLEQPSDTRRQFWIDEDSWPLLVFIALKPFFWGSITFA